MSDPILGAVFAAIAATSWATGAIFARLAMLHMAARTGTLVSLTSGFLVIATVTLLIHGGEMFAVSSTSLLWFAVLGFIQFPVGRFLNYTGIRLAGVAPATALTGSSPLFAALLAALFLQERVAAMVLVGTVAVVIGLSLVMSQHRIFGDSADYGRPAEGSQRSGSGSLQGSPGIGLLCALGGAVAYGSGHTIARHIVTQAASAPVAATYTLFFGMLALSVISSPRLRIDLAGRGRAVLTMAVAGVFSSFGIFFMYLALSRAPVTLVSPIVAVYPLVAMALTHLFLQRLERVTPRMVGGAVLVTVGVSLVILGRAG